MLVTSCIYKWFRGDIQYAPGAQGVFYVLNRKLPLKIFTNELNRMLC